MDQADVGDQLAPRVRAAGSNATAADMHHHLPFAEASLGHKPRKQKARSPGDPKDESYSPDANTDPMADEGTGGGQEPQQPPSLAAEAGGTEVGTGHYCIGSGVLALRSQARTEILAWANSDCGKACYTGQIYPHEATACRLRKGMQTSGDQQWLPFEMHSRWRIRR